MICIMQYLNIFDEQKPHPFDFCTHIYVFEIWQA